MSIRFITPPQPFSVSAERQSVIVVSSSASRKLRDELERYLKGKTTGVSFLIGGSRGSGKTTLVEAAVHDFKVHSRKPQAANAPEFLYRPLYVRVHGPSLFPNDDEVRAELRSRSRLPKASLSAVFHAVSQAEVASMRTQLMLEELAKNLYDSIAEAFSKAYRDRAGTSERSDALELAAQLQLALDREPQPAKLRWFWKKIGRLEKGVIFSEPAESLGNRDQGRQEDQGLREIVALAVAAEINLRLNNESVIHSATNSSEAKAASEVRGELSGAIKEIAQPLLAILAGAAVGLQVNNLLAGVLTTLAIFATLRLTFTRHHSRDMTEELVLLRDLSKESLARVVPLLMRRLQRVGLMPIFSIDELDKVEKLYERFGPTMNELKQIVGEDAFFCFLTGKEFIEELAEKLNKRYCKEYTYFRKLAYVAHDADDIRAYLKQIQVISQDDVTS